MNIESLFERRSLEIDFGSETLHISYEPSAMTSALLRRIGEMTTGGGVNIAAQALLHLLADWDLTDGDKPLPITAEVLDQLPVSFLNRVFSAIMEDIIPPPPTGEVSSTP